MARVPDAAAMRTVLEQWGAGTLEVPQGRWAIESREDGAVVGGVVLLPLPPDRRDLEIGWQLAPGAWGKGLAAEAGHAVAHYAFEAGVRARRRQRGVRRPVLRLAHFPHAGTAIRRTRADQGHCLHPLHPLHTSTAAAKRRTPLSPSSLACTGGRQSSSTNAPGRPTFRTGKRTRGQEEMR